MRTALLLSLLVHGAAATGLALLGVVRLRAEPPRPIDVAIRTDAVAEVERPPDAPAIPDAPPVLERWEFPEESPEPEEMEAPERPDPVGAGPMRAVRLARPLQRPRRARPAVVSRELPPVAAAAAPARPGKLTAPRRLKDLSPDPSYPARALRMGLKGTVVLLLDVSADGTVARVEIVSSSGHEELDRAAAEAARLWRFEPARRDGEAVAHDVRVPVEFRLTDA